MKIVTATQKGQILIPGEIRKKFKIRKGSKLQVYEKDGEIHLKPLMNDPIEESWGCLADGPSILEALLEDRNQEAKSERKSLRPG